MNRRLFNELEQALYYFGRFLQTLSEDTDWDNMIKIYHRLAVT